MRELPTPDFAGDDGSADTELREVMRRHQVDGDTGPVLAALGGARVLIPVVATLGESAIDADGLVRDKTADVAAVFLTGRDGRRALLAFTGTDSLQAWQPDARPVPVTVAEAARSALHDGGSALLLDVAGPAPFAVETEALRDLAAGRRVLRTPEGYAWVQPLTGDS